MVLGTRIWSYLAFDKLLNDQEADTDAAYREYCASKERLAANQS